MCHATPRHATPRHATPRHATPDELDCPSKLHASAPVVRCDLSLKDGDCDGRQPLVVVSVASTAMWAHPCSRPEQARTTVQYSRRMVASWCLLAMVGVITAMRQRQWFAHMCAFPTGVSRYAKAAAAVLAENPSGGVVYFPTGSYTFTGSLTMLDGVVLRGDPTTGNASTPGGQGAATPGKLDPGERDEWSMLHVSVHIHSHVPMHI